MLTSDITKAISLGCSARDIAATISEQMTKNSDVLRAELSGNGPLTRRAFCQLFGIGESTLTGWLQSERVPQSSAMAYALFLLASEALKLIERNEPRVIDLPDGYAVVKFQAGDDGREIGALVASGIKELATAERLAFVQSSTFSDLISRQTELLEETIETTAEAGNDTPYRMAQLDAELSALRQLVELATSKRTSPRTGKGKRKESGSVQGGGQ